MEEKEKLIQKNKVLKTILIIVICADVFWGVVLAITYNKYKTVVSCDNCHNSSFDDVFDNEEG